MVFVQNFCLTLYWRKDSHWIRLKYSMTTALSIIVPLSSYAQTLPCCGLESNINCIVTGNRTTPLSAYIVGWRDVKQCRNTVGHQNSLQLYIVMDNCATTEIKESMIIFIGLFCVLIVVFCPIQRLPNFFFHVPMLLHFYNNR